MDSAKIPGELSILIVEDHTFQRTTMVRVLRSLGATSVTEAADGKEALQLISSAGRKFDVVICDLDMPNMDGMEFIRHLGNSGSSASLILTSALDRGLIASVETMARAYGMHLLGAIPKPASSEKLLEMLKRAGSSPAGRSVASRGHIPESEILEGLAQKQFEAFFQPKVDLATGAIVGAEALARWRHPVRGLVPPDLFIPFLEASGNIDALTMTMLDLAARECVAWNSQARDPAITVCVNLSFKSLDDPGLADRLTAKLATLGLPATHVVFEITESAAMTDVATSLENLARLRLKGFGLSIDDYGTGYASMQQLSRIPFTELKIDRSFVSGAQDHPQKRVLLASSVDMARKLGLKVVAEGVETRAEWDFLKSIGCTIAQGYFVAAPMSAQMFTEWINRWNGPDDAN